MSIAETAKNLTAAMQPKTGPQPYDTQATVVRVEDDTLWVHIPGGVEETPVQRTINAAEGDVIQIRVGGGSAWAVGNASAPPTDDARANEAHGVAVVAEETAQEALELLKVQRAEIDQLFADWAQIGTAIINTLQATGINADWINAGTLNAARLAANSISTDKLSVGQGGNLYPVYDSFEQVTNDTLSYLSASTATPTVVSTAYARHGKKVLRITASNSATDAYVHLGDSSNGYGQIRLYAGNYVASCYVRAMTAGHALTARLNAYSRESQGSTWASGDYTVLGRASDDVTGTWKRLEIPFTLDTAQFVCLSASVRTASETAYFDCFQIEKVASGQGAGEWHPAGVTQLDGGNIVAQSIKADSLDVDSLFAEDITATGSFQVDNGTWKLEQTSTGLELVSKDQTSVLSVENGVMNISMRTSAGNARIGIANNASTNEPVITLQTHRGLSAYSQLQMTPDGVEIVGGGGRAVFRRTKTVTGTTTSNGNISLGLSVGNDEHILSVYRSDASSCCIPYTTAAGNWYARVQSTGASPSAVASTSVTLEVVYC